MTKARELSPKLKGLHQTSLYYWETGERVPSADQFAAWATALGFVVELRDAA